MLVAIIAASAVTGTWKASALDTSQPVDLNFGLLTFTPEADLTRSNAELKDGFSRRYENVANLNGNIIDAVVSIWGVTGHLNNEIDTFDEYDNSTNLSFHAQINGSSTASAYAGIRVRFFADNTNTPVVVRNIRASIADLDVIEFARFYNISSYKLSNSTQLSLQAGSNPPYTFVSSGSGSLNTDETRIVEVNYSAASTIDIASGCRDSAVSTIGSNGKCGFTIVIGVPLISTGSAVAVSLPSYTITYNENNATAGTAPAATTGSGQITIASNSGSLEKSTDGFIGWNSAADGSGLFFPAGSVFVPIGNQTLYAQYAPPLTATNDTSSGAYDTNQTLSPLTNDLAGSGTTLVASTLKLCATTSTVDTSCNLTTLDVPNVGTYTVNADGTVTFDPLPSFSGIAPAVKYVVADSAGQVTHATITPTVNSLATAPASPSVATPALSATSSAATGSTTRAVVKAGPAVQKPRAAVGPTTLPKSGSDLGVLWWAYVALVLGVTLSYAARLLARDDR